MCLIATAMVSLESRSLTEVLINVTHVGLFRNLREEVGDGTRRGDLAAAENQRSGCGHQHCAENQRSAEELSKAVESQTASRGEDYRMRVEQVDLFMKLLVLTFMMIYSRSSICLCIAALR